MHLNCRCFCGNVRINCARALSYISWFANQRFKSFARTGNNCLLDRSCAPGKRMHIFMCLSWRTRKRAMLFYYCISQNIYITCVLAVSTYLWFHTDRFYVVICVLLLLLFSRPVLLNFATYHFITLSCCFSFARLCPDYRSKCGEPRSLGAPKMFQKWWKKTQKGGKNGRAKAIRLRALAIAAAIHISFQPYQTLSIAIVFHEVKELRRDIIITFLLHLIIHSAAKRKHFNLTIHLSSSCKLADFYIFVSSVFAMIALISFGDGGGIVVFRDQIQKKLRRNPFDFTISAEALFSTLVFHSLHISKIHLLSFGAHAPIVHSREIRIPTLNA